MGELLEGLVSPLAQGFVRRALGAGLALGAAGALLGVFIVQRGLGLLSDGLAHATFGGLALGLLLGATVDRAIWVALPFTVAIALGIQYVRRLAKRAVYLDVRVRAWGPPAEVLDREWERDAFSGHDHDSRPGTPCEDE